MEFLKKALNPLRTLFRSNKVEKKPQTTGALLVDLQRALNYTFTNAAFLEHALIHKSSIIQGDSKGLDSNERLEFLGDAVLNCLVTEHIYHKYTDYSEGQLSKVKSLLVSRKIIGEVAQTINLADYLSMGHSEKKSSGQNRTSITSNAFEALLGAVYLDGGIKAVRNILSQCLFGRIEQFRKDKCNINYKSKILEMSQADGFGIPQYPLIAEEGPDHDKKFIVGIDIAGVRLGKGEGSNKKNAQQDAAQHALEKYDKEYILTLRKGE